MREKDGFPLNRLAIPICCEMVLNLLVGSVDQLMISAYSDTAVAAIGNVNQIMGLVTTFFTVFSSAAVVLISQFKGAEDFPSEKKIYTLALIANGILSFLLSAFFLFGREKILQWMNVAPNVLPEAKTYLAIVGGTVFLQALFLSFSAFLKSNTLMKNGMYLSIAVNLINVAGNFCLINGYLGMPRLGVLGAAISTAGGRLIGLAAIIAVYFQKVGIPFSLREFSPFPKELVKKFLYVGLPTAFEPFSYNMAQIVLMSWINTFGLAAVNTKIYVSIFTRLPYLYSRSLGNTCQVLVGRCLGAGDTKRAKLVVSRALWTGFLVSTVLTISIFLLGEPLLRFFTQDPEILKLGKTILFIDIFVQLGRSFNQILVGVLQSAGDVIVPTASVIAMGWIASIGVGYLLSIHWGLALAGLWMAMILDENGRGIILYLRWRSEKWKKYKLAEPKEKAE